MLLSCVLLLFFCILVYIGVCFVKSRRLSYVSTKLKQSQRRRRRQRKNNWFYEQYNSSARASRLLVHFFDVHRTVTT